MKQKRSRELITVGFFLSKYGEHPRAGERAHRPPIELGVDSWGRAYAMFYRHLGAGRTLSVFANTLKNSRDSFDSHVESGRVGWRASPTSEGPDRPPRPLTDDEQYAFDKWSKHTREDFWKEISVYCDEGIRNVEDIVLSDLAAELDPEKEGIHKRTEGGRKVVVSARTERDPSLRSAALRIHGTACAACGFSFGEAYGPWGEGFAIVHHIRPFGEASGGERETDPTTDLVVLCANCHCMVHRKKDLVLEVHELKAKLRLSYLGSR